jgi:hypothetical protein
MTVAELINILGNLNQDSKIMIKDLSKDYLYAAAIGSIIELKAPGKKNPIYVVTDEEPEAVN